MATALSSFEKYPFLQDLFRQIPPQERQLIQLFSYKKGTRLVERSQFYDNFILIAEGVADVSIDTPSGLHPVFYKLSVGNAAGLYELISSPQNRWIDIVAHTDVVAVSIPSRYMMSWCSTYPTFTLEICHRLMASIYSANTLLAECMGCNLYLATITYLLYVYDLYRQSYAESYVGQVRIEESRQNIADFLGADVRSINRAIERLKQEEMVTVIRGKIYIDTQQRNKLLEARELGGQ